MSLINDALKRAREQQRNEPPGGPPLSPFRPAAPRSSYWPLGLGLLIVLLLAGAGILIFLATRPAAHPPVKLAPAVVMTPKPMITPSPAPATMAAPVVVNSPPPATNPLVPAVPPKPDKPQLQGIFFQGSDSTAIISGKLVRIGDVIKGYQIKTISRTEVHLIGPDRTETILTLNQ